MSLLSCEKVQPIEIPEPQKEEEKKPEENKRYNDEMINTMYLIIGGGNVNVKLSLKP